MCLEEYFNSTQSIFPISDSQQYLEPAKIKHININKLFSQVQLDNPK